MPNPEIIQLDNVSKSFATGGNPLQALALALVGTTRGNSFQALTDVSFCVTAGETVGFVGRNGAGKSTLLQILCGTTQPTAGSVAVTGRIGALLELGAGFNPLFTGRENAYLSAAAHGVPPSRLDETLKLIEDFADIGAYFDRPVRQYSSGMMARLAFGVSTHVDADLLVVDEILGVGDSAFQMKCQRKMAELVRGGATLLFVSHDPAAIATHCKRAIWLEGGRLIEDGPSADVVRSYLSSMYRTLRGGSGTGHKTTAREPSLGIIPTDALWKDANLMTVSRFDRTSPRHGFGGAEIVDCYFADPKGLPQFRIRGGEDVTLLVRAKTDRQLDSPVVGYILRNDRGQNLFGDNTFLTYMNDPVAVSPNKTFVAKLSFRMPYLPTGRYMLAPSIIEGTQQSHIHLDWLEDAVAIDVIASQVKDGCVGLAVTDISVEMQPQPDREKSTPSPPEPGAL